MIPQKIPSLLVQDGIFILPGEAVTLLKNPSQNIHASESILHCFFTLSGLHSIRPRVSNPCQAMPG